MNSEQNIRDSVHSCFRLEYRWLW